MGALFEIQINHQIAWIDIKKSRTDLQVYIDDIEQDAKQSSCEFRLFLYLIDLTILNCSRLRFNVGSFRSSLFLFFNFTVEFHKNQTLKLKPKTKSYIGFCALPIDTVDELDIN